VAIDEFDSGIFEYLLGEVIEVFSESAKGQLIFTSHNLRPLEILGNNGIYLTTTDPNNRYARYSFVREESNFRNKYLRAVKLDSAVTNDSNRNLYYSPTFDGEIRHAFRSSAHEK
jgi:AAA15 family ATPase/GTPase